MVHERDQEPARGAILRATLGKAGYQVVTALDAMQGPMQARKEKPDLVILDIMMPAGGGFSVFERLRQNNLTMTIPILIYSAVPPDQLRLKLPEGTPILTKPQDLEKILGEIKKLLP